MAYGHREFIIALGHRGDLIKDYFLKYYQLHSDLSVNLADGAVRVHGSKARDWTVHLIDTGLGTQTGGRVKRLARWIGDETFLMTYGDGVARIDLDALVAFHRGHGKLATVTAVRPPARFGEIVLDRNAVKEFTEKPQVGEGWVNGGYFVLEPAALDYIEGDDTYFEREPLERLAQRGQLMAFQHDAFWQCMDALRDLRLLQQLWDSGQAPWKIWPD
jgi:glucose-1-phosphate cytidylyltransferase